MKAKSIHFGLKPTFIVYIKKLKINKNKNKNNIYDSTPSTKAIANINIINRI
jgi:hypothetical protein